VFEDKHVRKCFEDWDVNVWLHTGITSTQLCTLLGILSMDFTVNSVLFQLLPKVHLLCFIGMCSKVNSQLLLAYFENY